MIEIVCAQDGKVLFERQTHEQAQRECGSINDAEKAAGSPTRVYARPQVATPAPERPAPSGELREALEPLLRVFRPNAPDSVIERPMITTGQLRRIAALAQTPAAGGQDAAREGRLREALLRKGALAEALIAGCVTTVNGVALAEDVAQADAALSAAGGGAAPGPAVEDAAGEDWGDGPDLEPEQAIASLRDGHGPAWHRRQWIADLIQRLATPRAPAPGAGVPADSAGGLTAEEMDRLEAQCSDDDGVVVLSNPQARCLITAARRSTTPAQDTPSAGAGKLLALGREQIAHIAWEAGRGFASPLGHYPVWQVVGPYFRSPSYAIADLILAVVRGEAEI